MLLAPDAPAGWDWARWATTLSGHTIAVSGGYDAAWERTALLSARAAGRPLLSIRVAGAEVLIGPAVWSTVEAEPTAGCAGCAQARNSVVGTAPPAFGLGAILDAYLLAVSANPLGLGDLVSVNADGSVRRHHIRPVEDCPVCGTTGAPDTTPAVTTLARRPASQPLPTRGTPPFGLDPTRMRRALVGPRYGPVTRVRRKGRAPFAMTEVRLLGGQYPGYGRGRTFRSADAVAILEAYERYANVPRKVAVIRQTSRRALGDRAIEPAALGHYTPEQLAARSSLVQPYHEDVPMDWVWGRRLRDGVPLLVPAEIGFYRYAYDGAPSKACFDESSSGSALGGSYEEATLHSLIELTERDAFLQSWHCAVPLPRIDPATVADRESRMLLDLIDGRGYDLHLLVATADIPIPVVWALAVHREYRFPATFSSAGASPDPVEAVRSALWELGQLVGAGTELDEPTAEALDVDLWRILQIEDHVMFNALPRHLARVQLVLGGPVVSLVDAFQGWPEAFIAAADGDVTGALEYVRDLFADAGLDTIVVVDQSSAAHRDIGLAAVKAVVPGIVPMCFGHQHQRLAGLRRLFDAMAVARGVPVAEADIPFDPHPFP